MKPYWTDGERTIYLGDCRLTLPQLTADFVITDPPYELGFMGKEWDKQGISFQYETWRIIKNSCKPGAMMLTFGGTRTWHRIAVAIEDAGWEIRDTLGWIYGQGFPKSLDISKVIDKADGRQGVTTPNTGKWKGGQSFGGGMSMYSEEKTVPVNHTPSTPEAQLWSGYGTALKPAWEPIILSMKPLDGTFAENALKHGVAGLNIDGSRVDYQNEDDKNSAKIGFKGAILKPEDGWNKNKIERTEFDQTKGRFPANLIHDGSEEVLRVFPDRFFYCAKASKTERDRGCEELEPLQLDPSRKEGNLGGDNPRNRGVHKVYNNHPTVKPLALMKYLCNLLKTPTGGVCLDPFMGSGTTLLACQELGIKCIGIDTDEHSCEIAAKRMSQTVMPLI